MTEEVSDTTAYVAVTGAGLLVADATAYAGVVAVPIAVSDTGSYAAFIYTDPSDPIDFFPYPPPGTVKERLEYLTDLMITYDGSEDRTILRSQPRQIFSYTIPANSPQRQRLYNMFDQNLRGTWKLPIWTEAQAVALIDDTALFLDLEGSDYRVGSHLMAFKGFTDYQVREIVNINYETGEVSLAGRIDMTNIYVMPVNQSIVIGDAGLAAGSFSSEYKFDFLVDYEEKPQPYMCFCITPHASSSVPDELQTPNLLKMVEILRGLVNNSGYKLDVRWYFWKDTNQTRHDYYDCDDTDFDAMITVINAQTYSAGTTPNTAAEWALDWFGTENPNPGDGTREDVWVFTVFQGGSNMDTAAATVDAMVNRTAPFDGYKEVDIYTMRMEGTTTIQVAKIDNVDHDRLSDTTTDRPFDMTERFSDIFRDHDAGDRFGNYEILGSVPEGTAERFTKTFTRREDKVDYGGPLSVRSPWTHGRVVTDQTFYADGLQDVNKLKRLLNRAMGKARGFWIPSFTENFVVQSVASDFYSITVDSRNMNSYTDDRNYIAVLDSYGYWRGYEIDHITPSGDQFIIALTTPLPADFADRQELCWLGLGRFDTDNFELNWVGNKVVTLTAKSVEISR